MILTKKKKYVEALESLYKARKLNGGIDESIETAIVEVELLESRNGKWSEWWIWSLALLVAVTAAGLTLRWAMAPEEEERAPC